MGIVCELEVYSTARMHATDLESLLGSLDQPDPVFELYAQFLSGMKVDRIFTQYRRNLLHHAVDFSCKSVESISYTHPGYPPSTLQSRACPTPLRAFPALQELP